MNSAVTGALHYDSRMTALADVRQLAMGCVGISSITFLLWRWPHFSNATTVALGFLVVVLLVAASARLWVAVTTSIVAMLAFNFFFLPPVGALVIADPQNWVALFAFLAVSMVASNLSAVARDRTKEAVTRRDELARLLDVSRDILLVTDGSVANSSLAACIARRFDLQYVAICLPSGSEWNIFESGAPTQPLAAAELSTAFAGVDADVQSIAREQTHEPLAVGRQDVRAVPLRFGTKAIGLLAIAGRPVESATLDAVAGLAALALERVHFLDERKTVELARQSEELKSALLASLSHDLRTPLTAIRIAADNLRSSWPDERERREQGDLIVTEIDRLTRLFQNILEMARIDAGAVANDARWVAPSEIVDAARSRVDHALRGRTIESSVESDHLVRLDPRLIAAALSHLLENAAEYTPRSSSIHLEASVSSEAMTITVRDHGPGIAADDLPHVFSRFYRGAHAKATRHGTGMGLAIARGILAVVGGRISAENCADGGARFTIVVPAEVK
jgi:two-component system, OmpR family, sensor histidine kinase KdpD